MLDKRTHLLLERIGTLCDGGGYRIIEESELFACFPPKLPTDREGLSAMLRYLRAHGYIEICYAEEGVYCCSVLPEGRIYTENERLKRAEETRRRAAVLLCAAIGALIGGFLGALFAFLAGGMA